MKLFNKVNEGFLRGFGLIQYTDKREVINLTWSKDGFSNNVQLGFSGHISRDSGIFLGITIWKRSVWLQLFGETVSYSDPYSNDIEF